MSTSEQVSAESLSDTPRTDVATRQAFEHDESAYVVPADFARQLERELIEALKGDARYRWLRDATGNSIMRKLMKICTPEGWDSEVDNAMGKKS